jgi:hypothetical protein
MPSCGFTATGPSAPFYLSNTVTVTNADGTTSTVARTDFSTCEFVVLSGQDYANTYQIYKQVMSEPFSPAQAGEYFGFAFATTIMIWSLAYGAGRLVDLIKNS